MQKNLNRGFTLIEVLISILVLGVSSIAIYTFLGNSMTNQKNIENTFKEETMINEFYEIFCNDPKNFINNIESLYHFKFINNELKINSKNNLSFDYIETKDFYKVIYKKNMEVKENWIRKKVVIL